MADFSKLEPFFDRFGLSDDAERSNAVGDATEADRAELIKVVRDHEQELDAYFADPAIDPMSKQYIALSATRMAADECEAIQETVSEELRKQRTAEIMNALLGKNKKKN